MREHAACNFVFQGDVWEGEGGGEIEVYSRFAKGNYVFDCRPKECERGAVVCISLTGLAGPLG